MTAWQTLELSFSRTIKNWRIFLSLTFMVFGITIALGIVQVGIDSLKVGILSLALSLCSLCLSAKMGLGFTSNYINCAKSETAFRDGLFNTEGTFRYIFSIILVYLPSILLFLYTYISFLLRAQSDEAYYNPQAIIDDFYHFLTLTGIVFVLNFIAVMLFAPFTAQTIAYERSTVIGSIKRSYAMAKGKLPKLAAILGITVVVYAVLAGIVLLVVRLMFGDIFSGNYGGDALLSIIKAIVLVVGVEVLYGVLVGPLVGITYSRMFLDHLDAESAASAETPSTGTSFEQLPPTE